MYPDCDWLISQKLQSILFSQGAGGRNSAENANYAENCKIQPIRTLYPNKIIGENV